KLAHSLEYALKANYVPPQNFYGIGGMKIFRDLIWQMQGLMKADHKFYKAHGQYDFPQKKRGTMIAMYLVGGLLSSQKIKSKMGNMMNEGMLMPYNKMFEKLKKYAEKNKIHLIGDIPFYVSLESCDVWANPECFKLGYDMTPVLVAGVPPDVFSASGQLWGNPIYDWEYHKKTGYIWWKKRLLQNALMYDVIRIDHFRAFNDFYTIPYGAHDAKSGKWEKGVGMHFWDRVKPLLRDTEIIAEDLGGDTDDVKQLINDTGFPNMSVLQFAFDSDAKDPFLPKNMSSNTVCYTGTHDNDTTLGCYKKLSSAERIMYEKFVPKTTDSVCQNLILFGMKSRASTVIIPLQDYLELDSSDRMNTPGKSKGNWEWRFEANDLNDALAEKILNLSKKRNK
ncbi:MAG: 4-alpha-glucanotransferase, partial [Clostridia bacterium]|nr:4-alpha-glucanotransferase [Clostridia bacterium]